MDLNINKTNGEKSIEKILPLLSKFINPKYKIIKRIQRISEYFDDPKFYHFGAILQSTDNSTEDYLSNSAGGFSFFSEEEALLKCLGESLERYHLRLCDQNMLIKGSFVKLKEKAINPNSFVCFSQLQRKNLKYALFNFNSFTPFLWKDGFDLIKNKPVLIPAQLIYLSYKLIPEEKFIYAPISTGAAGGSSLAAAITRGIYEIIERDAFLIFYLNKLPAKKIDLQFINDTKIMYCVNIIKSYSLELFTFDITTELDIPTFLSIVVDRTGIGPAVSLGLKTHINPLIAILGSIEESLHPRGWIRGEFENNPNLIKSINTKNMISLKERAVLWYPKTNIKKLNFLLKQKVVKQKYYIKDYSWSKQLKMLKKVFIHNHMDVFFSDLSSPIIQKVGYHVIKAIIPQLYPFYLIEAYPYHGGTRLYELPQKLGFSQHKTDEKSLNKFPHPFI